MDPRFNEVPRDWEIGSSYRGFVISRFNYYWAEECGSLYRGLRLIPDPTPLIPDSTPLIPDPTPLVPNPTPFIRDPTVLIPDRSPLINDSTPLIPAHPLDARSHAPYSDPDIKPKMHPGLKH